MSSSTSHSLENLEERWSQTWDDQRVYQFDRSKTRDEVFSIDTPPPTVSGTLHIGHCFSYTHTDIIARFQRMRGKEVFYPMGWDDNGLPTERRVQNYYGVRCEPFLPYDTSFVPPAAPDPKKPVSISRRNFVELCERLTRLDEQAFEQLWRRLGLSVDWSMTYQTIDINAQKVSQSAFLRNLARGEAYHAEAPTLWDVTFRTAVAQAELEEREWPGSYYRVGFHREDGTRVYIETTRPELLPACVALIVHPEDERYQALIGKHVSTPIFGVHVPVFAHRDAEPDKGTGIAMCCTFGDVTDVLWWRELQLPTRTVIGWDGRILPEFPRGIESVEARAAYGKLVGATVHSARERIVEMLREAGHLEGEARAISRPVKFFEKGDRPLEIRSTRQWYLRNGNRDSVLRHELLSRGRELTWHPGHMKVRYDNWVSGLNSDWLVSRQRFFGVPIPIWYSLDDHGLPIYDAPIVPSEDSLPIDPSTDVPPGYSADQRDKPGGFMGDPDVLDTWATSSLTPEIAGGWSRDEDLFHRVYPMDMRAQAHEIIRTWLFSTVLRSHLEHGLLPWRHTVISGWIIDPDRKKMSKSKGNVVTPVDLLKEYGSDAVRYWAANGRPGTDTAFDTGQMKVGRRLTIKIFNASKFALAAGARSGDVTEPIDKALLGRLAAVVNDATVALESYDYTRALERIETFFWYFCDDYLELIKARAYGEGGEGAGTTSVRMTLMTALDTLLRLFAPFLPFITEEVWSWWREGSIHRAPWPDTGSLRLLGSYDESDVLLDAASAAIAAVRKAKSEAKLSMRSEVKRLVIEGDASAVKRLESVLPDLRAAGSIDVVDVIIADRSDLTYKVELSINGSASELA
ncbi:MAG: valine--tRNA ligase [Pseudonocardiales bacterium]